MGQQVGMEDQEWAAGPEWGWHGRGLGGDICATHGGD